MVVNPVFPVSSGKSRTNSIPTLPSDFSNNNQLYALLASGNVDPKFAVMLINQITDNNVNSIMFGSDQEQANANVLGNDLFGAGTDGDLSSTLGISNPISSQPSQFELSVYSTLIGKTVTALNPQTNVELSGKVSSVQLQNGNVMLDVDGTLVPSQNLKKIKQ